MKQLFSFIVLSIFSLSLSAQTTVYYNKDGNRVSSPKKANYYKTTTNSDSSHILVKTYYKTGQIRAEESFFKNKKLLSSQHEDMVWLDSITSCKDIENIRILDGKSVTYWHNGNVKRNDIYQKGKLIEGKCMDTIGNELPYFKYIKEPEFPGGLFSIQLYMHNAIRYPPADCDTCPHGILIVYFIVEKDGTLSAIKKGTSIRADKDAEILKMVRSMPKWHPALKDGKRVNAIYTLPVLFRKSIPKQNPQHLNNKPDKFGNFISCIT
jgi:hypothetical protein